MDPTGARNLAARIKTGVSVGSRIELVADVEGSEELRAGDRGVVEEIDDSGIVRVTWERGFVGEVDPERTPFRRVAA